MPKMDNERFFPATPDETLAGLIAAIRQIAKFKSVDDFTRSVQFATRVSGFSWGAQMSAQVVPAEGGAMVRVEGKSNMTANFTAGSSERKNILQLLDATGAQIQAARRT